MKANELRIGNWVEVFFTEDEVGFGKNYYAQIVAIQETKVMVAGDLHWHPIEKIRPIPLTPEILEMAGFEKDGQQYELNRVVLFFIFNRFEYHYNAGCQDFIEVRFIHQLQNLYWCLCLCGEELTIKMKEK